MRFKDKTVIFSPIEHDFYVLLTKIFAGSSKAELTKMEIFKFMPRDMSMNQFDHRFRALFNAGAMKKRKTNESGSGYHVYKLKDELE